MPTVTVGKNGRITLPKAIRDRLDLRPGDKIEFVEDQSGIRVQKAATSPFSKWRGYLKHMAGQDVDELIEEMRGR